MKKTKIKIIAFLMTVLIAAISLSGCTLFGRGDINEFADELFPQLFANDALSANFFLESPSKLGIYPKASLYTPSTKSEYETNYNAMHTQAALMASMFRYSKMNDTEKELFDFIQSFFEGQSKFANYYYFQDNYIGSYLGSQANLPIYLTEYKFRELADIENCLALCNAAETAFPTYVDFEKARIENGYGRATYVYIGAIQQCEAFTGIDIITPKEGQENSTENFVLTNLKSKIKAAEFLTADQKTEYTSKVTSAINDKLLPAYVKLGNDILSLLVDNNVNVSLFSGDNTRLSIEQITASPANGKFNNKGLANFSNGKEYYELLFQDATGTNDSVSVAMEKLKSAFISYNTSYWQLYSSIQSDISDYNSHLPAGESPKTIEGETERLYAQTNWNDESELYGIINTLKSQIAQNFPEMPASDGKIILKQIDESLADNYSPAAFFVSALDNPNSDEVIVINSSKGTGYMAVDLLTHEGIPGHLYQYSYLKNSDHHNFVKVLCPSSYKEAWAVYCQYYMADYFEPDTFDGKLFKLNLYEYLYNGFLRSMVDIWINYDGLSIYQVADKCAEVLQGDSANFLPYLQAVYPLCVEVPTNSMTYFYGFLSLMELKTTLSENGTCKTDLDFHKLYLDNPYSFAMIRNKYGI